MTEKVRAQLELFLSKDYRQSRSTAPALDLESKNKDLPLITARAERFLTAAKNEIPVFHGEYDRFGFNRYQTYLPKDDRLALLSNMTVDYESFLAQGINGLKERIDAQYPNADALAKEFYDTAYLCLDGMYLLVEKYREAAKKQGRKICMNLCKSFLKTAREIITKR